MLGTGVDAEEDIPVALAADVLDDYTSVFGEGDDDADVEKRRWGVGPGDGDLLNGGGAGGAPVVDFAWPRCCK